jgi:tRNA (cytidine/uridine-2'-O-)-methyltransferase
MLHVLLYQPEIPPNTGNVMRLCANTGASLHLIEPLGFRLDHAKLKRAGLDYREWAHVQVHPDLETACGRADIRRLLAFSSKGATWHTACRFEAGDGLLFGPETRGLPEHLLAALPAAQRLRIPMRPDSRSLNLSNAVAIAVYEAWRQLGFEHAR